MALRLVEKEIAGLRAVWIGQTKIRFASITQAQLELLKAKKSKYVEEVPDTVTETTVETTVVETVAAETTADQVETQDQTATEPAKKKK